MKISVCKVKEDFHQNLTSAETLVLGLAETLVLGLADFPRNHRKHDVMLNSKVASYCYNYKYSDKKF